MRFYLIIFLGLLRTGAFGQQAQQTSPASSIAADITTIQHIVFIIRKTAALTRTSGRSPEPWLPLRGRRTRDELRQDGQV